MLKWASFPSKEQQKEKHHDYSHELAYVSNESLGVITAVGIVQGDLQKSLMDLNGGEV